jgi:hypothetical protein
MKAKIPWQGTNAQKKAMVAEINRQIIEREAQYAIDYETIVLYTVRKRLGHGKKRLRQFYEDLFEAARLLAERYEMQDDDAVWLCDRKLKEIGVDVKQWHEEMEHGREKAD